MGPRHYAGGLGAPHSLRRHHRHPRLTTAPCLLQTSTHRTTVPVAIDATMATGRQLLLAALGLCCLCAAAHGSDDVSEYSEAWEHSRLIQHSKAVAAASAGGGGGGAGQLRNATPPVSSAAVQQGGQPEKEPKLRTCTQFNPGPAIASNLTASSRRLSAWPAGGAGREGKGSAAKVLIGIFVSGHLKIQWLATLPGKHASMHTCWVEQSECIWYRTDWGRRGITTHAVRKAALPAIAHGLPACMTSCGTRARASPCATQQGAAYERLLYLHRVGCVCAERCKGRVDRCVRCLLLRSLAYRRPAQPPSEVSNTRLAPCPAARPTRQPPPPSGSATTRAAAWRCAARCCTPQRATPTSSCALSWACTRMQPHAPPSRQRRASTAT